MERLIGGDGEKLWLANVCGDPVRPEAAAREEVLDKAIDPLITNGESGGEDKRGLVDTSDDFESENSFA